MLFFPILMIPELGRKVPAVRGADGDLQARAFADGGAGTGATPRILAFA